MSLPSARPNTDNPAMRASDADREQTACLLQEHFAAGRLSTAEFDERTRAAYAARTRGPLHQLTADLPAPVALPTPAPAPLRPQRARHWHWCCLPW